MRAAGIFYESPAGKILLKGNEEKHFVEVIASKRLLCRPDKSTVHFEINEEIVTVHFEINEEIVALFLVGTSRVVV